MPTKQLLKKLLCSNLLAFAIALPCTAQQMAEKAVVKFVDGDQPAEATVRYYLFIGPAAKVADKSVKFPLLLFLYGSGERIWSS